MWQRILQVIRSRVVAAILGAAVGAGVYHGARELGLPAQVAEVAGKAAGDAVREAVDE